MLLTPVSVEKQMYVYPIWNPTNVRLVNSILGGLLME